MPPGYEVWLKQPAYDYLESLDLEERQRLLEWIERLKKSPFREGDFVDLDHHGREHQVAIVGNHAVSWWWTHPCGKSKSRRSTERGLDLAY